MMSTTAGSAPDGGPLRKIGASGVYADVDGAWLAPTSGTPAAPSDGAAESAVVAVDDPQCRERRHREDGRKCEATSVVWSSLWGFPSVGRGKGYGRMPGNARHAFATVAARNVVERRAAQVGERLRPTWVTYAGWFGLPRCGTGARYGTVGLGEHPIERAQPRRVVQVGRRLERDDAAERQVRAAVEALPGLVGAAGEAVEDRPLGRALGVEDVERVVPRIAGVDDQRQAIVRGRVGSARRTPRAARVARRVVVEVVEPALADGDDVGIVEVGGRSCRRRAWPRAGASPTVAKMSSCARPLRWPARSWPRRTRR